MADRDPGAAAAPRTDHYITFPNIAFEDGDDAWCRCGNPWPCSEAGAAESGASRRNAIDEIARLGQQIENAESGASPAAEDRGLAALRDRLMALLGPSHPHDEGKDCGACAAYNLLAALPHGEPARTPFETETRFFWLIERGQPEGQTPTVWLNDRKDWATDAYEAVRFHTREEAEEAITDKLAGGPPARAVEHGFIEPARTAGDPLPTVKQLAAALHAYGYAPGGCTQHREQPDIGFAEDVTWQMCRNSEQHEADAETFHAILTEPEWGAALSEASSVREPGGEGDHEPV